MSMSGVEDLPQGNDGPSSQSDDDLLLNIFTDKAIKFTKPQNLPFSNMPGPPKALPKPSTSGVGGDAGNDRG